MELRGIVYLVGDSLEADTRKTLARRRGRRSGYGAIFGAVSEPAAPGTVVKVLAAIAMPLNEVLTAARQAIRGELWNHPLPDLRR